MGVVNVTPDSFSDGGQCQTVEQAVARGLQLVEDGADILDIGGESTRPGAQPVSAREELGRILPVIERLSQVTRTPISVDTSKAKVAEAAISAGAELVNDISGGSFDPEIVSVAAEASAVYICSHLRGDTIAAVHASQSEPLTPGQVAEDLAKKIARLPSTLRYRTIVDPGLGFGKPTALNVALSGYAGHLGQQLICPVLVGPSRKRFVAELGGETLDARDATTVGVVLASVFFGANLVRVHNVQMVRAALRGFDAICVSRETEA